MLLCVCLGWGGTAAPLSATEPIDLVPNSHFTEGEKHWKRYTNFVSGDVVSDWTLRFEGGQALIDGRDCQPQSRVGFRSDCIPLEPALKGGRPTVFRLQLDWRGRGIHRSGFYFILNSSGGKVLRLGEVLGPAGDFDTSETFYFQVAREDLPENPCLTLYAFHDGVGRLVVRRVSLVPLADAGPDWFDDKARLIPHRTDSAMRPPNTDEPGPEWRGPDAHLQLLDSPERSAKPASTCLVVRQTAPEKAVWDAFESGAERNAPLLPDERRLLVCDSLPQSAPPGSRLVLRGSVSPRRVAWFWDYAVARTLPFGLSTPAPERVTPGALLVCGDDPSLPPLPPLPGTRSVYLYYYGKFRYGGRPEDLADDKADLRLLRDCGVTGLCIQDNYGLAYARWSEGKTLDPSFLLTLAQAYQDAGFRAPLVFGLFAGLEKGRVRWDRADEKMETYLMSVAPHLREAEKILGPGRLWIAPVDEPNDADRRGAAKHLLPLWRKALGLPLMITVNWYTSGELRKADHLWIGGGDYPSFEAFPSRNITGFYCGLDSQSPLRMRWLAGVQAWASGLDSQAYWHFCDVHGSPESDLDDGQEDFLCIRPEARPTSPTQSLAFLALQEGWMDLRLLCALDSIRESSNGHMVPEIADFLSRVRATALPTDRPPRPWNTAEGYRQFRNEAVRLWIGAHARFPKPGQPGSP